MRFSLYLYGDFNGSLLVAIEENGTTTAPLVWERNGQWTDDWEDVALQLTGLHHGYVKNKRVEEQMKNNQASGVLCIKVTSIIQLYPVLFAHSKTSSSVIFPFRLFSMSKQKLLSSSSDITISQSWWWGREWVHTLDWWWETGKLLLLSKEFPIILNIWLKLFLLTYWNWIPVAFHIKTNNYSSLNTQMLCAFLQVPR